MPTLEITDHEVIEITEMMILGVMLYPSDEVARRHWVLRSIIAFLADEESATGQNLDDNFYTMTSLWLGDCVSKNGGWGGLANATALKQRPGLQIESKERIVQGKQAGMMLLYVLSKQDCNGIAEAARKITDYYVCTGRKDGFSPRTSNSNSLRNRIWPRYRAVAHLWAAWLEHLRFSSNIERGRWIRLSKFYNGGLQGFLNFAEEIRIEGSNRTPRRGPRNSPFLPPEESWILQHLAR